LKNGRNKKDPYATALGPSLPTSPGARLALMPTSRLTAGSRGVPRVLLTSPHEPKAWYPREQQDDERDDCERVTLERV